MAQEHEYLHDAHHDHIHSDPGSLYNEKWVQDLLRHIENCLETNKSWLGIAETKPQRILDYACGNGIISRTLAAHYPNATFHGLDIATSQVERYNNEAAKTPYAGRMHAIQGDITSPLSSPSSPEISQEEWFNFDIALISMALHHVKNPIEFLRLLKQRVRKGGVVIVLDWLITSSPRSPPLPSSTEAHIASQDQNKYQIENMTIVPGGKLKIWHGFSNADMHEDMTEAGLMDVDVLVYADDVEMPEAMGGKRQLFMAKASVV